MNFDKYTQKSQEAILAAQRLAQDYGARPLKRTIQRELQDPLALKILAGEFHEGETIQVDRDAEGLTFKTGLPVVAGETVNGEAPAGTHG